jgi:hypothetical protein
MQIEGEKYSHLFRSIGLLLEQDEAQRQSLLTNMLIAIRKGTISTTKPLLI